jgi:hypothetical protein
MDFVDALDRRLRQDLGARAVFRDVNDLIVGEPFARRIAEEIQGSDGLVLVIGPHWAGQVGDATRLEQDDDFVRQEVQIALNNQNRVTVMPVLVGAATIPTELPEDIRAVKDLHYIKIADLKGRTAPGYQQLLVGAWVAKKRAVPNGVLVFGGDSPMATARLDKLVDEMIANKSLDVRVVSRFASGARVLTVRKAKGLAKKLPDVIVLLDQDPSDSEVLAARIQALGAHRFTKIAVLSAGAGVSFAAGSIAAQGVPGTASVELSKALAGIGKMRLATEPARLAYWPVATAAKVGVTSAVALIGVGLVALQHGPVSLTTSWAIEDWRITDGSVVPNGSTADLGSRTITINPLDCQNDHCQAVVRYNGKGDGVGVTLTRTNTGWHADMNEAYDCSSPQTGATLVAIASLGEGSYDFRSAAEPDRFEVDYSYQGSPTPEGIAGCPGGPIQNVNAVGTAIRTEPGS